MSERTTDGDSRREKDDDPGSREREARRADAPRRFWLFARRYQGLIRAAALGNLFTVFLVMLTPLFVKLIIDEAIPGRNVGLLVGLALGLFLANLLQHSVGVWHNTLTHYIGQRTVFDIRKALFHHLQLLHLAFYERARTASLVNRVIHDAIAIQQFVNTAFTTLSNSIVSLLIALGIMMVLNWKIALFCMAALPFYFLIIHRFRRKMKIKQHEVKERQSVLAGMLGETFAGIRVVKSFGQEEQERQRFVHRIKDNFQVELELPLIGQRMNVSLGLLSSAFHVSVLIWGGLSVIRGEMTLGSFVAFLSYLTMLFSPIQSLSQLIIVSTNARTGFERILDLLDIRPEIVPPHNPVVLEDVKGRVTFERVGFAYRGDVRAVEDFQLDVPPGRVVALVGSSGSGKSTLMSLLTRFYDVSEGRILIDGVDLRQLDYDAYRQQLGIVQQENFLFSGTVEDNIRYGRPEASDADVRRAAELANALEFIDRMPEGLQSEVGQGGVTLSGGQRQRIAIARCILKNPRILIFDEATSALDNESEALIQNSMDTLMRGRTVFIVAHRLTTIRKAHQIVVMDRGRIVETGTHDELLARGGRYAELHRAAEVEEEAGS